MPPEKIAEHTRAQSQNHVFYESFVKRVSVEKSLKVLSLLAIVNGECCLSRHQRHPILTLQHDATAHRARGRIANSSASTRIRNHQRGGMRRIEKSKGNHWEARDSAKTDDSSHVKQRPPRPFLCLSRITLAAERFVHVGLCCKA
jgi:hypothetical protein